MNKDLKRRVMLVGTNEQCEIDDTDGTPKLKSANWHSVELGDIREMLDEEMQAPTVQDVATVNESVAELNQKIAEETGRPPAPTAIFSFSDDELWSYHQSEE